MKLGEQYSLIKVTAKLAIQIADLSSSFLRTSVNVAVGAVGAYCFGLGDYCYVVEAYCLK